METLNLEKSKLLRIANCRGKKPVLRDIKRARTILQDISIEINDCEGARDIDKCVNLLWDILEQNQ